MMQNFMILLPARFYSSRLMLMNLAAFGFFLFNCTLMECWLACQAYLFFDNTGEACTLMRIQCYQVAYTKQKDLIVVRLGVYALDNSCHFSVLAKLILFI